VLVDHSQLYLGCVLTGAVMMAADHDRFGRFGVGIVSSFWLPQKWMGDNAGLYICSSCLIDVPPNGDPTRRPAKVSSLLACSVGYCSL